MRGCVIGRLGGGASGTLLEALFADTARAIRACSASDAPAERLAAAKDLVLTLRLLKEQITKAHTDLAIPPGAPECSWPLSPSSARAAPGS